MRQQVVRRVTPELSETPVFALDGLVTHLDKLYVRNHFPTPTVEPARWHLAVGGLVALEQELSLAELESMPQVESTSVLECAGNGGHGVRLQQGGFGVVTWRGVPAGPLLQQAGVLDSGRFVTANGHDTGRDPDEEADVCRYERSIPLDVVATRGIVATVMNGEPLPRDHGFPARLVIPGWYGMDWVKWLDSLTVTDQPSTNVYTATRYRRYQDKHRRSYGPAVGPIAVKSVMCQPAQHDVTTGDSLAVTGLAWTGLGRITTVEARVGTGPWLAMTIGDSASDGSVVRWSGGIHDLTTGACTISSRATDSTGASQPLVPHGRMYEANHVTTTVVYVVADSPADRLDEDSHVKDR